MKVLIFCIFWAVIAFTLYWVVKVKKKEGKFRTEVLHLLLSSVFPVGFQSVLLITDNEVAKYICIGLYFATLDLMLFFLAIFIGAYTDYIKKSLPLRIVGGTLLFLDAVSFIVNIFTHHVFTMDYVYIFESRLVVLDRSPVFFTYHLVVCYLVVAVTVGLMTYKCITAASAYRVKYRVILLLIVAVISANAYSIVMRFAFDASVVLYCLVGMQICYYTMFFTPQALIDETLAMVVKDINEAVFCFDVDDHCVYFNDTAKKYFGEDLSDDIITAYIKDVLKTDTFGLIDINAPDAELELNGEKRIYNIRSNRLYDTKEKYVGMFFSMYDRTEEIREFEENHKRLSHDRLTGLYNREYFFEMVEKRIKDNPDTEYILVCSNIRGFKIYNDMFGEAMGDQILIMEADLLRRFAHEQSIYGRISGDEFAVLVPAEKYKDEIFINCINAMRIRFNNPQYKLHIYVGVYMISDNDEKISVMCDKARMAIESHKGDYNTIITYYSDDLMNKIIAEKVMLGEFDCALDNREFKMYLQPQVNSEGKVIGAEALVRWIHPEKGMISPGAFIPVFEKTGLIYRLDRFIWEEAAKKLGEWKKTGREDLYISVNVSSRDFYYIDIVETMKGLVRLYDIRPENLRIELTETVIMTSSVQQSGVLESLRENGFIIEIDDFGSGYSSLNMLKNIDVDVVKIDMGFLDQNDKLNRGESILNCMVDLLLKLGLDVITEGVETEKQYLSLRDMGCDLYQGFFFARPMAVEEFDKKYAE